MLNGKESIEEVKNKISNALNDGSIQIKNDTAYFRDGRVASGISTETKEAIVESILHCLQHGGFDGNTDF